MAMTKLETVVLFHSPARSSWKITFSVIPYSSALLQPARGLWLHFGVCVSSADRIKATGKSSLGTLVIKGRVGKMSGSCLRGNGRAGYLGHAGA